MLKTVLSMIAIAFALFGFVASSEAQATKPAVEKATAYITAIKVNHGKMTGSFDYIQWYFGKDADREFVKDCKCGKEMPYAPDGYYIRNINKKIRTFPISNSAQYVLQTRSDNIKWNEKVTKTQFLDFLKKRNQQNGIPFHLEIKGGVITKITEQYIP